MVKSKSKTACPFCQIQESEKIVSNKYCFAIFDSYAVTKGHILVVSTRHFQNYFKATLEEKKAFIELIDKCKRYLDVKYKPDGFNIGININPAAGQTVMHVHIHVIPRYEGDIEDPTGGVRGVIPHKRIY